MRRHAHAVVSAADLAEQRRAEDEARQRALYGDAVDAVRALRQRGHVITVEPGGIRVDHKLLTRDEVKLKARGLKVAVAAVLRRPKVSATGLKVGQVVKIERPAPVTATPISIEKTGLGARLDSPPPARQQRAQPVEPAAPRQRGRKPEPKPSAHSLELGALPRSDWIVLADLHVDKIYQRDIGKLGHAHVNRIARLFNWNCYQPIVVAARAAGGFTVIDGQHRLEAARRHPLIDKLPCYVIDAPDVAQQAVFVSLNSARVGLTSQHKFWAAHAAGDEAALALVEICERAGVRVLRSPISGELPAMAILAPIVCLRQIRQHGAPAVRTAIELLAAAHPKTTAAFRSYFISALTRLAVDPSFLRERAAKALAKTDLAELQAETIARSKRGGGRPPAVAAAEQLLRKRFGMKAKGGEA